MCPGSSYIEEEYWSEVSQRIQSRGLDQSVAGDNDPYYRYKRRRFLEIFLSFSFDGKDVLEVGSGPGGNLMALLSKSPKTLAGVDISQQMIELARSRLPDTVSLDQIDGMHLPFSNQSKDIVYTVTVLQHVTTSGMVEGLISEICRVSRDRVYLCERIESTFRGDAKNMGRPLSFYREQMQAQGFELYSIEYLDIQVSYLVSGIIRKLLNNPWRNEGSPSTAISVSCQRMMLPLTRCIDPYVLQKRDLAIMTFERTR